MPKRNLIVIIAILVALAAVLLAVLTSSGRYYEKGLEALERGDLEEALDDLEISGNADAAEMIAAIRHHQKAAAALDKGDFEKARKEAEAVPGSYPRSADVKKIYDGALKYEKGIEALKKGEYEEAAGYFDQSVGKAAADLAEDIGNHMAAAASLRSGNYRNAMNDAALVPESYPRYDEVREIYDAALALLVEEYISGAKESFAGGEYMDAYKSLRMALEYDPENSEALGLRDAYQRKSKEMEAKIELLGRFLTDPDSIAQRKMVNINDWNKAGYTGKGLTILHDDTGDTPHSKACASIIQTILPDATVIRGNISGRSDGAAITDANIMRYDTGESLPFDEAIEKWNISMINNSTDGGKNDNDSPWAAFMRDKIAQFDLVCTGAAGNRNGMTNPYQGAFIIVGSVAWNGGDPQKYGASGDAIDFSMFTGYQPGTSFASPFLCGMAGLLKSRDLGLGQEQVYSYFRNHSMDLGAAGKDPDYGWGLPILGSPEE